MPIFNQQVVLESSPTISTSIYAASDVVGGLITLNVASAGGGGTLRRVVVADDDNEKAALTLYFFSGSPSAIADQAAFAPTMADLRLLVDTVDIAAADYVSVSSNAAAYAIKRAVNMDYAASTLYCYVVCTGTPTYTAVTDLTFRFFFWKD